MTAELFISLIILKENISYIHLCLHIKKEFVTVIGIGNVFFLFFFFSFFFWGGGGMRWGCK